MPEEPELIAPRDLTPEEEAFVERLDRMAGEIMAGRLQDRDPEEEPEPEPQRTARPARIVDRPDDQT